MRPTFEEKNHHEIQHRVNKRKGFNQTPSGLDTRLGSFSNGLISHPLTIMLPRTTG
jgi:hypothetical protein